MSKRSHKPSMKVMDNFETEEQLYGKWRLCCIFLMLHPGLKIMPFKLTGYCRLRSKDGKFKSRSRRMQNLFTAPNGVISTKTNEISARKAICSQLETLEKRAIIYNFVL